jgi:hypothetical protein
MNFPSLFKVHSLPANINHKRQHQWWIIFHDQSSVQLSTIKQNAAVATLLSQTNGHLSSHPWQDSVQDVVSLGFFVCAIPHYQSSDSFTSQVVKVISKTASTDNIPLFPMRSYTCLYKGQQPDLLLSNVPPRGRPPLCQGYRPSPYRHVP